MQGEQLCDWNSDCIIFMSLLGIKSPSLKDYWIYRHGRITKHVSSSEFSAKRVELIGNVQIQFIREKVACVVMASVSLAKGEISVGLFNHQNKTWIFCKWRKTSAQKSFPLLWYTVFPNLPEKFIHPENYIIAKHNGNISVPNLILVD